MNEAEVLERFYLSKGDKVIYIENNNIPINHIDGIRFLYKQYTKENAGVILNELSWESRNIQIVLFLKAIHKLLNKTILILCPEGAEQKWLDLFQQFHTLGDVICETEKPFLKRKVIINPVQNLAKFCGHEWGIVVVDDDQSMTEILRLPLKAGYKIWSSPTNMKKNLQDFSRIYKWLHPKDEFNEKDFIPKKKNLSDVVDKAILLDAFMDDIVLWRNDVCDTVKKHGNEDVSPKVSRKNKDCTGTKIKRSKRKINDEYNIPTTVEIESTSSKYNNANIIDTRDVPNGSKVGLSTSIKATETKIISSNNDVSEIDEDSEDFTIHKFKRKKYVIEDIEEPTLPTILNTTVSNTQSDSELNLHYDDTEDSEKLYEMDTLPLESEMLSKQASNITVIGIEFEDEGNSEICYENNEISFNNCTDMISNGEIIKQSETKAVDKVDSDTEVNISIRNEVEGKSIPKEYISQINATHTVTDANPNVNVDPKQSDVSAQNEMKCDEISIEALSNKQDFMQISQEKTKLLKSNNNTDKDLNKDELCDDLKPDINEINVPVTNNATLCTIDDKMKEFEENAMKKFKGSLLDNIF